MKEEYESLQIQFGSNFIDQMFKDVDGYIEVRQDHTYNDIWAEIYSLTKNEIL